MYTNEEKQAFKERVERLKNHLPTCYAVIFTKKNRNVPTSKIYSLINRGVIDYPLIEKMEKMFVK